MLPAAASRRRPGSGYAQVFDRYNIVSETDLKRAARQLGDYLTRQRSERESGESHTIVTQADERTTGRVM